MAQTLSGTSRRVVEYESPSRLAKGKAPMQEGLMESDLSGGSNELHPDLAAKIRLAEIEREKLKLENANMQLRNANLQLQLELAKIKQATRLASKPVAEPTLEPVPEPAPTSQSPEDMGLNASGGNKKDPQATESATEPNVSGGNKEDLQEAKQAAKLAAELAPETN